MEKHNKISSKMYKHLAQQKVHNICVTYFIKQFALARLMGFFYK